MSYRFTETEKWKDGWFLNLSPASKAVFEYLRDNCSIAGFMKRDDDAICLFVGVKEDELEIIYNELSKSVVERDSIFWLKNFIRYQRNNKFNNNNLCHKSIIKELVCKEELFGDLYYEALGYTKDSLRGLLGASKGLLSPYSNSNSNSNIPEIKVSNVYQNNDNDNLNNNDFNINNYIIFNNIVIKDLWDAWVEVRTKKKVPNTRRALDIAAKHLEEWGEEKAIIALTRAVERGWRGLFKPEDEIKQPKEIGRVNL